MLTPTRFIITDILPTGNWKLKRTIFGTYRILVEAQYKVLCAFSIGEETKTRYRRATKDEIKSITNHGKSRGWKHKT